jgi:adenylate cyclase
VNPDTVQRKLAAILSADVVGYSRLMAEDEVATIHTLTAYREQLATLIREHRGRVVDCPGDNLLAEFPSALEATRCAVVIQRVVQARNVDLSPERKMQFRIGVHLGDVMVEGDRIYGDGVNIAARLEGLAEPGGICLSRTVHEQVEKKLGVDFEDLGERVLKNIPRPVRIYRVKLGAGAREREAIGEPLPGMDKLTVPGFSGRPAIAVLPLNNLSGDPEQEYFADGIAEDLITRLSSCRAFPVIARNSSFIYKGRPVDVKQVSRDLGVRYVVEGSVRRTGDRVRISAQLIDATTGAHIWAERYDRELKDMFAVQDEITEAVVASMNPELFRFEQERAARHEPRNLGAWDCVARGFWHYWQLTQEGNSTARSLFQQAVELDPHFAPAFGALAAAHYNDVLFQWTDSPPRSVAAMAEAAQRSVALDDKYPLGQFELGWAYSLAGQRDKVFGALELATRLDPSFSLAYASLGTFHAWAGRPDDGMTNVRKAMRLSPHDPYMFHFFTAMAIVHFAAERYEDAADWARRALQRRPDFPATYRYLAASYAHLGRLEEARTALEEMFRLNPEFSLATDRVVLSTAEPAFVERLFDGLRKAGLKE